MNSLIAITMQNLNNLISEGILLVDKGPGTVSFSLVRLLRKRLNVAKIGHAGTLDPFATGVMVMLIGKKYTRLSDQFLTCDKEYQAEVFLGASTDTHDCDGKTVFESTLVPSLLDIEKALSYFQGTIEQIPPMFSAKKIAGKKLYDLARQGQVIERAPVEVHLNTQLISYDYPFLKINVICSKGTYIRSIANDLGLMLGCGAHLKNLRRTRSGSFSINQCINEECVRDPHFDLSQQLAKISPPFIHTL